MLLDAAKGLAFHQKSESPSGLFGCLFGFPTTRPEGFFGKPNVVRQFQKNNVQYQGIIKKITLRCAGM